MSKLVSKTALEFLKVVNKQTERDLPEEKLASLEPASMLLGSNAPANNSVLESQNVLLYSRQFLHFSWPLLPE